MTNQMKAVIADDEKALRDHLRSLLRKAWPDLVLCGEAKDGEEALDLIRRHRPHVAFLDIKMPGLSGLETAAEIAGACHVVFVTAFEQYAVDAFEREAVDYLLKPVTLDRLRSTVERLKKRLAEQPEPLPEWTVITERILAGLKADGASQHLHWIRAQQGDTMRLIPVEEVHYFQADEKYTLVFTKDGEQLIRKSIKELAEELDPHRFWQIHRGTIVNVSRIDKVSRSITGRGVVRLKDRTEVLTISRRFLHLFKQM